jgi:hypothetical protein
MQDHFTEDFLYDFPCISMESNSIFQPHQILATELYGSAVDWERAVLRIIANEHRQLTYEEEVKLIEVCNNLIENSLDFLERKELLTKLPGEAIGKYVGVIK